METIEKAYILFEFTQAYYAEDTYDDFFAVNDIGVPMSIMLVNNLCVLTDEGIDVLNETYANLCETLGVDENKNYADLDDIFDDTL